MRTFVLFAAGLVFASIAYAQQPHPASAVLKSHITLTPEDIKWGPCTPVLPAGASCVVLEGSLSSPNALFAYRLKMPDDYRIPAHFHPADEHLVVIRGVFNLGHGDKLKLDATRSLPAGSFIVLPKGMHHFAWTTGETIIQVYAIGPWGLTYVDAGDDPRNR